jgi:PKD repeat protein
MWNYKNHILLWIGLLVNLIPSAAPVINSVTPNSAVIGQYEKFELTVDLSATFSNPYNYSEVYLRAVFISPGGQTYYRDGFYFQDYQMTQPNVLEPFGQPGWRIRFSPNQTGAWSYYVSVTDATGSFTTQTFTMNCTPTDRKGFVKKSGSRMVFDNGETFHGLGVNLAFQWWWDGFTAYEDWLDELHANGGNFTKISIAPWIFEIEWLETGLGQYSQRQNRAWALDWVFDQLMEKRIYCQFNHLIHTELRTDHYMGWNQSPYNNENGGVCTAPHQFLTYETAISLYKRKLRYMNARWGFSPYLAQWEHISEADNTDLYSSHHSQLLNWLNIMSVYINSIDQYNRPVSTGFAIPQHDESYWNNINTDFTQLHIYSMIPDLEMHIYNYSKWHIDTWHKPHIVSEFSMAHTPEEVFQADPTGIAFHNTLWASMFSGSFASAMSWWWDNYLYPNGFFSYFQPIAGFFSQIEDDISTFQPNVPLCYSDNFNQILIDPDYNNQNNKAPENYFHFEPSGLMYPNRLFLGRFIFGSLYGGRRNPPTFKVNYQNAGEFKVRTGSTAVLSKIKIQLNGNTILNQGASTNSTYTINVPAGIHEIRVENSSLGICEIENYQFHNYAPELRTFTYENEKNAAGWFQNRNYNWEYVNQNGEPAPVTGGQIFLKDKTPGVYEIKWYNSEGNYTESDFRFETGNDITIAVPEFIWDGAFQLRYISPVQVAFSATPVSGEAPLTVQFTDESINTGGAITAWNWNFGDGGVSTLQNPQHIYNTPGIYTVTLEVVSGQYSNFFTRENYINVVQPLVAEFTSDTTVATPGRFIHFTDLSLGDPTNWLWNFGNNTFSFSKNPVKSYPQPGIYDVSLLIQLGNKSDFISKPGYIEIIPPLVANFAANKTTALVGEAIQFLDNSTGNPQSFFWDFGDGNTSTDEMPVHSYNQPGAFSVKLIVSNQYLNDTLIKENYITIPEPMIADFSAMPQIAWPGEPIQFNDLSEGFPENWNWQFGDSAESLLQNPTHTYTEPGLYDVSLEIWDDMQNDFILKENLINIKQPLEADFTADKTVIFQNEKVQFFDLSKGNPQAWFWNFGSLGISSSQHPSIWFNNLGMYDISLTIYSNDSSDFILKEDFIVVIPELIADFIADTVLAITGQPIQFTDQTAGNPDSWNWQFGNQIYSQEQNPLISFDTPGNYSVELIAANQYLTDTVVKDHYIQIIEPLSANFSVLPFEGKVGELIKFYDESAGNPTSWEWWFGNGDTSYLHNPMITFLEPGVFDVTLIVENEFLNDTLQIPNYYHVIAPFYNQAIQLDSGWNGISTYIKPVFSDIVEILNPVSNDLYFAYNSQGIYFPGGNINTIQNWEPKSGLIMYMNEESVLQIEGYSQINASLQAPAGWSILPVLTNCDQDISIISNSFNQNLILIKEIAGWRIFWPEMGIKTLEILKKGKSYYILLQEPQNFTFPGCDK